MCTSGTHQTGHVLGHKPDLSTLKRVGKSTVVQYSDHSEIQLEINGLKVSG